MLPVGPAALPKGSEVVFFNIHAAAEVLGRVVRISKVENVSFLHVQGNPLDQQDIREKLNLARHAYILFFMISYSIYVIGFFIPSVQELASCVAGQRCCRHRVSSSAAVAQAFPVVW